MSNEELANRIFPNINNIDYYEKKYPNRDLDPNQLVTRFAPSPTGFVHMGSLYTAFLDMQIAYQTKGVFYLRIEDTDHKREVEDGITGIINDLNDVGFILNEGTSIGGNYGPYIQSERKEIYQAYIKELLKKGFAYLCFCTEDELNITRTAQENSKSRLGYYGSFAKCRTLDFEKVKEKLDNNIPYVIRLKSPGNFNNKVYINDLIKGKIEFPENDLDIVIMKSDGLPTYHFAHAIDDHLMHTTTVIRGDEWVSSIPIHLQLFNVLGFKIPDYAHVAPITKKDGDTIRKLSKRKDPEASIHYYQEQGLPNEVLKLYLSTIANYNFEEWYNQDPTKKINDFKFDFKKMPIGGSLFDLDKLLSISRTYFSRLSAEEIYNGLLKYTAQYDKSFYTIISTQKDYTIALLNIERNQKRPRKDIYSYSSVKEYVWYMYKELFTISSYKNIVTDINISLVEDYFTNYYSINDTKDEWYQKIVAFAPKYNYASSVKEYKENEANYCGHIGTICEMIRVLLTSLTTTPDLYEICRFLGQEGCLRRINLYKTYCQK